MITADDLGDIDREALERALKLCAAQDAGRAEQIAAMLDERSWAVSSIGQCNTACSLSAGVSKPKVFRGR
jgi:hypothetical protein